MKRKKGAELILPPFFIAGSLDSCILIPMVKTHDKEIKTNYYSIIRTFSILSPCLI
jgi:hypothetical protein